MPKLSRREFMQYGAQLAAAMGLGSLAAPQVAEALAAMAAGKVPVLWLQALACTGCSITTLNAQHPGPAQLLTRYISLRFHSNLSGASGDLCAKTIRRVIAQGGHLLVVEGAIPAGMPEGCIFAGEPVSDWISKAATQAKAAVALGTCAAFGGIPAAEPNPTGAVDLRTFLKKQSINTPLISLPGCPPHPDWLVGTLVHILQFGMPSLDKEGRPKTFYGRLVHDQCPRFADYERENFGKQFGQEGCLFKLGCTGPNTYADCTQRLWNGGTNSCIKAGSPCIGCASKEFAAKASFPLYRKYVDEDAKAKEGKAL